MFIQAPDQITVIENGGTYCVYLSRSAGGDFLAMGLTRADADVLAEEVATACGLDWKP